MNRPTLWLLGGVLAFSAPNIARSNGESLGLLEQNSPTIVRVEVVLSRKVNMSGQGQEDESRIDVYGTVVSPGGLIMLWNSSISSFRMTEVLEDMGQGGGFRMEITPTAFSVQINGKEESAFLAATDSSLDLAFIQLEDDPEIPLPFVDFEESVDPEVGDLVIQVARLGRSFDQTAFQATARIGGELRKPRRAWILDGALSGYGLPVFDSEGSPIGTLTTIFSRAGNASGTMGRNPLASALGLGSQVESLQSFVLPGKRVATLVRLAAERANELRIENSTKQSSETEAVQ